MENEALNTQAPTPEANDFEAEAIAQVCYEANRAYCKADGDDSRPAWDEASEYVRAGCVKAVQNKRAFPDMTLGMLHESWAARMFADGWTYGETQDNEAKTHPSLLPFYELPERDRNKVVLFYGIADNLLNPERAIIGALDEREPPAVNEVNTVSEVPSSRPISGVTLENLDDVLTYHTPNPEGRANITAIRAATKGLIGTILERCPSCADRSHAIRLVRDGMGAANASIALQGLI